MNKDLENAWAVQWIRQEKCAKLEEENKKLNEKVRFLEECLDNKEKVNKSLREENKKLKKYYDRDKEELMESCYSLAKERDELREENKTLKDKVNHLEFDVDAWYQLKLLLEWEIEKLKSDLMQDMKEITELEIENKNLNWRIANLKEEAEDRGKIIEYYKHDKKLTEKHIKKLKDRIKELFWKIYQLEEENENLRKDLFHKTNDGKAK